MNFEDFFRQHFEEVRRVMFVAFSDVDLAEDSTQEAFMRAYRRWREVEAMDRPIGWVIVVAHNAAQDLLRRRKREQRHADPANQTLDFSEHSDDRIDVASRLSTLAERQRMAVVLHYLGDLSIDDVSQAMGCAPGTVKATLHAALGRLGVSSTADVDELEYE